MEYIFNAISMLGGLALFLYGMSMLGTGLEKVAGSKLERTLEKMTSNIFKGVLVGAVITAAIQSSSATTVIVVGLVNAGILKLRSAIPVIMGANIGTTVTGQILKLVAMDTSGSAGFALELIKPTTLAPLITIVGILMFMVGGKKKTKMIGEILLGFGILFNGMFMMTDAVEPLSKLPQFEQLFATLSNPFLGVLAGTIVTAVIQSSSASVGILQSLATTGVISYSSAFPIIMGQNIGTCVTSLLSSIGANVNAKRAAMVHLYFNIIGTIIFFIGVYSINTFIGFPFWNESIGAVGVANFHTLFNVVVTILLLPFVSVLEKLATITIKAKQSEENGDDSEVEISQELSKLDDRFLKSPSIALAQCEKVVAYMGKYALKNFKMTLPLYDKYNTKVVEKIEENEDTVDRMEDKINNYLLSLTGEELTPEESRDVTRLLKLGTDFERVGDYTINLVEGAEILYDRDAKFSDKARKDLEILYQAIEEIIDLSIKAYRENDEKIAVDVEPLEETIDLIVDALKEKHIERLKNSKCTIDGGFVFLEVLTNLERISDHCSNVAISVIGNKYENEHLNRHEYKKAIHAGEYSGYNEKFEEYKDKYLVPIKNN